MKNQLAALTLPILLITSCCGGKPPETAKPKPEQATFEWIHVPDSSDWREMKCGLFMSPGGVIGYASDPFTANFKRSELPNGERCNNSFITFVNDGDDTLSLRSVIDTATFKQLDTYFYSDKNHIYNYYAMCGGGFLTIFGTEPDSIRLMGIYVAYKGKIYHERNGLMDADYKTFRTCDGVGARDKYGYFLFEDRVTEQEAKAHLPAKEFQKLKKAL